MTEKSLSTAREATIEDDQSTRYYMTLQQAVDAAEDDETVVVAKGFVGFGRGVSRYA